MGVEATRGRARIQLCDLPAGCPGETVFNQPWELRIIALVVAAHRSGAFAWDDFQSAVARAVPLERGLDVGYESWVHALETVVGHEPVATRNPTLGAELQGRPPTPFAASPAARVRSVNGVRRRLRSRSVSERREAILMLGVIALMHVVGFGVLVLAVAPQHFSLGAQVFSVGLGLTAYAFGLRHAFDADHLAAIDNTTRKLRGEGVRSSSVGFWFAMGHSSLVFVMAALVSVGAHAVSGLTDETSPVRTMFRTVASLGSSGFLYLIGLVNMIALVALLKVWAGLRRGEFDQDTFESHLQRRGFLTRILNRFMKSIRRPWHMFSVGAIFGLSFDTATEIALLVLAGTGAAQGVPWYAIMVLPMLFAAGMTLLDWMNGLFMTGAYDWAYVRPARKVFYNLAITGISVAVAVLMGTIQLAHFLQETYSWTNPLIDAVTAVNVNVLGFFIIGICLAVWAVAALYWKAADVDGESAEASAASDEKGR